MAAMIPAGESTKLKPSFPAVLPARLFLETTASTATPAAECGIMIGISIMPVTTLFNGKFLRARRYAKGIAPTAQTRVPAIATQRVSQTLPITSGSPAACASSPREHFRNIAANGARTNITTRPPSAQKTR
ncbi:MAG: hypothetical protein ACYTAN_18200 [Planctomycetota bacterium]|jgi:hypothetical protein